MRSSKVNSSVSAPSLNGRRILVTGATTGIGRVTAVTLGRLGADVVIVARDPKKAEETLGDLRAAGAPEPTALLGDLSLMAEVRRLADEYRRRFDRLDVLVNNAGAIFAKREMTSDGFERTFALNHMSYFLLTNLLLDRLQASKSPRLVNVSSEAHRPAKIDFSDLQFEKSWSSFGSYCVTKLENLLFTFEFARRFPRITSNAVHPGAVASNFGRSNHGWFGRVFALGAPFMLTPEKGARTSIFAASAPELDATTGKYFAKSREKRPSRAALDEATQKRMWDESARLFGLP
jgi:NAD(P)-dependent dehydrogenase (short-subunit alcohol dehydrogenase family)